MQLLLQSCQRDVLGYLDGFLKTGGELWTMLSDDAAHDQSISDIGEKEMVNALTLYYVEIHILI